MKPTFQKIDSLFITEMHQWGIPLLRYALAIVFIWFGLLKVMNASPAAPIIAATYWFLPQSAFMAVLGIWECLIGILLMAHRGLRVALLLLWLQMLGIFIALLLYPPMFFGSNPFLLTFEGEFVIKNIVLIAASLVVGGYELYGRKNQKR
ncbi:MAG: hypothetical protein AAB400_03160 [Patescibacteria group bacterium]